MIDDLDLTVRTHQATLGGVLSPAALEAIAPGSLAMFDACCPDLAERDDVVFRDLAHVERRYRAAMGQKYEVSPRISALAPAHGERLEMILRTSVTARRAFARGETREAVIAAGWTTSVRWVPFPESIDPEKIPPVPGLWVHMTTNVKINPKRLEPREYPVEVCCRYVAPTRRGRSSLTIRPGQLTACDLPIGHDGECCAIERSRYDATQRDIRGNHVSIDERRRIGEMLP